MCEEDLKATTDDFLSSIGRGVETRGRSLFSSMKHRKRQTTAQRHLMGFAAALRLPVAPFPRFRTRPHSFFEMDLGPLSFADMKSPGLNHTTVLYL